MSYRSSQQRVLNNVLYDNNTLLGNLTDDNLSSIEYVNNTISTINLTTQKNELITLQNELNSLNTKLNILQEKNNRVIGSIIPTILLNPPINYLICNGQSLIVSNYQQLFNIIGYNYGGSALNFNLPDLRNYYILGGNNNINNLSFSNLFSGNGTTGGINNYLKFGSVFPSGFPLLTEISNHTHIVNDNGDFHDGWSEDQPFATIGTEGFIKKANQDGNFNVGSSTTGLTLKSSNYTINPIHKHHPL